MKKTLAAIFLAFCFMVTSIFVCAQDGGVRRDLNAKRQELRNQRKRLEIINDKERDIANQLNETQYSLQESRTSYNDTILRLDSAEMRLENIRTKLAEATDDYKTSQRVLGKRLREIYLEGDVGYIVVLLGAESFTDFLDHARYLSIIIANDQKLLEKVRTLKEELESQEKAAKQTVLEIQQLKKSQAERIIQLTKIEQQRSDLLAEVQGQRDSIASYVTELEGSTRELEAQLQHTARSRQRTGRPSAMHSARSWGTGTYCNPAEGPVTSYFGYRVHPIYGTMRFHSGIDIGAYYGSDILAADTGVVIESGWIGGYGNTIMIDHGGGYSTLYGHCSALYVSYGQTVQKGQPIAAVGSTGNSTGPHLHFEVRINGNPVDPLGFI